jgi:hypothetical protein
MRAAVLADFFNEIRQERSTAIHVSDDRGADEGAVG